jgi:hypothetical protein
MRRVLLLDERIREDGVHLRTSARTTGQRDRVHITDDDGTAGELSVAAIDRVMVRYGRELDPEIPLDGDALDLAGGYRLRRLRHHAPVDATGRDYLVWERPGEPPLAVVATMATAALRYLVLRLAAERPQESEG